MAGTGLDTREQPAEVDANDYRKKLALYLDDRYGTRSTDCIFITLIRYIRVHLALGTRAYKC